MHFRRTDTTRKRKASMSEESLMMDAFSTTTTETWKQVSTTLRPRPLTMYDLQKLSNLETVSTVLSRKLRAFYNGPTRAHDTMTKHLKLIRISNEKVRAYLGKL